MLKIRAKNRQRGFTLVESMVGLTLLGVLMTGIFGSMRLSMLMSESTIYKSTANNISQGYLEQIKSITYEDILLAIQNPSTYKLNTVTPTYDSNYQASIETETITLGSSSPIEKEVLIDIYQGGETLSIKMPLKCWITIEDMNVGTDPVNAVAIKIRYSYQLPLAYGGDWRDGQVQGIRARI